MLTNTFHLHSHKTVTTLSEHIDEIYVNRVTDERTKARTNQPNNQRTSTITSRSIQYIPKYRTQPSITAMLLPLSCYSHCHATPNAMLLPLPCYSHCHATPIAMLLSVPCYSHYHATPTANATPNAMLLPLLCSSHCHAIPIAMLLPLPCYSHCHATPTAMPLALPCYSHCHATLILTESFRNIQRSRIYDKFYEKKKFCIYIYIYISPSVLHVQPKHLHLTLSDEYQ